MNGDRPVQNDEVRTFFQRIDHRPFRISQVQQDEGGPCAVSDVEPAGPTEAGQSQPVLGIWDSDLSGLGIRVPPTHGPEASHELELAGDSGAHQGAHIAGIPVEEAGNLPGFLVTEDAGVRGGDQKEKTGGEDGFPEEEENADRGKKDKGFPFCFLHHHHLNITLT